MARVVSALSLSGDDDAASASPGTTTPPQTSPEKHFGPAKALSARKVTVPPPQQPPSRASSGQISVSTSFSELSTASSAAVDDADFHNGKDEDASLDCFLEFLDKQVCGPVLSSDFVDLFKSHDLNLELAFSGDDTTKKPPLDDTETMLPHYLDVRYDG